MRSAGLLVVLLSLIPGFLLFGNNATVGGNRILAFAIIEACLITIASAIAFRNSEPTKTIVGLPAREVPKYALLCVLPLLPWALLELIAVSLGVRTWITALHDWELVPFSRQWPSKEVDRRIAAPWGGEVHPPIHIDGLRINKLGLRAPEPRPKLPGEWRVAVTGGSTTWGWMVRDEETIPAQLEKALHDAGHTNVSVINLGIAMNTLADELKVLSHFRSEYDFDQVISYTGSNDLADIYNHWGRLPGAGVPGNASRVGTWAVGAARFSDSLFLALWFLRSPASVHLAPSALDGDSALEDLLENGARSTALRRYQASCADWMIRCDFFLQPTLLDKQPRALREEQLYHASLWNLGDIRAFATRVGDEFLEVLPEGTHDLREVLDGHHGAVFFDLIHLNAAGNRIVADAIAEWMLKDPASRGFAGDSTKGN